MHLITSFFRYLLLTTFLTFAFVIPSLGQNDTLFLNKYGKMCSRDKATDILSYTKEHSGGYSVTKWDIDSSYVAAIAHALRIDSPLFDGAYTEFYKSGKKSSEGIFKNYERVGEWKYYYREGSLWYTQNYDDGGLKSYYKSGKLKREEISTRKGKTKGKCYDEQGAEIEFTTFEKMPKAPYSIPKYLSDNLRYPKVAREKNIEGRVLVKFFIDEHGDVTDPEIVESVCREIDAESLRVVSMMGKWDVGMQDDKPVKVYFTLPINFKLH